MISIALFVFVRGALALAPLWRVFYLEIGELIPKAVEFSLQVFGGVVSVLKNEVLQEGSIDGRFVFNDGLCILGGFGGELFSDEAGEADASLVGGMLAQEACPCHNKADMKSFIEMAEIPETQREARFLCGSRSVLLLDWVCLDMW